jgi:hypothetical protein
MSPGGSICTEAFRASEPLRFPFVGLSAITAAANLLWQTCCTYSSRLAPDGSQERWCE